MLWLLITAVLITAGLIAVALALLLSRAMPYLAAQSLRAGGRLASPAVQLALGTIARSPGQPMRLVRLLSLTLSLGVFAAIVCAFFLHIPQPAQTEAPPLADAHLA